MKNLFQFSILLFAMLLFVQCTEDEPEEDDMSGPETVTDIDGNVYQTVQIGDQTWMVENLKVTSLNDGTALPEWTFGDTWYHPTTVGAQFQWASTFDLNNLHDEDLPVDFYGAIYNEHALNSGRLAPEGWRIPTPADWEQLEAFLAANGHAGNEATALKSDFGWVESSGNGTDAVGFRALPNGYAASGGTATGAQVIATFATTETDATAQTRTVVNIYNEPNISFAGNGFSLGAGVRCIKE